MDSHLEIALKFSVPMWVEKHQDKSIEWLMHRKDNISIPKEFAKKGDCSSVRSIASLIGERGDVLQWGSKNIGEAAWLFNLLSEGIAILSMCCKGGVDFGDLHFEYPHKDLKEIKDDLSAVQETPKEE